MEGKPLNIMKLAPFVAEKVWGGDYLKTLKGVDSVSAIGETLEVSTLRHQNATVNGIPLAEQVGDLRFLVKFIETTDNLSVQVHPGDIYAQEHENSLGKTECWLILSAEEGAGIYLGFKPGVSKSHLKQSIAEGKPVDKLLNFYPVEKGDFFFVPSGAIHAIGKGVLLAEVQQSCGVTYRVWDWNRLGLDGKPRELHLSRALDVIEFDEQKNVQNYFQYQKASLTKKSLTLANHPDFRFNVFNEAQKIKLGDRGPNGILNFSHSDLNLIYDNVSLRLGHLDSAIVLPGHGELDVAGKNPSFGQVF